MFLNFVFLLCKTLEHNDWSEMKRSESHLNLPDSIQIKINNNNKIRRILFYLPILYIHKKINVILFDFLYIFISKWYKSSIEQWVILDRCKKYLNCVLKTDFTPRLRQKKKILKVHLSIINSTVYYPVCYFFYFYPQIIVKTLFKKR